MKRMSTSGDVQRTGVGKYIGWANSLVDLIEHVVQVWKLRIETVPSQKTSPAYSNHYPYKFTWTSIPLNQYVPSAPNDLPTPVLTMVDFFSHVIARNRRGKKQHEYHKEIHCEQC